MKGHPKSYLVLLIGKTVTGTSSDLSLLIPLKNDRDDVVKEEMSVYTQIHFEDYSLHVYNPAEIICSNTTSRTIESLIGLTVTSVSEEKICATIFFDNGCIYKVNLSDEAYTGPEAMGLFGPENFWVIWN
jgi:hypothetical protein